MHVWDRQYFDWILWCWNVHFICHTHTFDIFTKSQQTHLDAQSWTWFCGVLYVYSIIVAQFHRCDNGCIQTQRNAHARTHSTSFAIFTTLFINNFDGLFHRFVFDLKLRNKFSSKQKCLSPPCNLKFKQDVLLYWYIIIYVFHQCAKMNANKCIFTFTR